MPLRSLLSEPLVQFLVIGAAVAGLYGAIGEDTTAPPHAAPEPLIVTDGRVEQLAELFERTWQRSPTAQERADLVESFIREEVLYRAGRELGLAEDDPVIRRRIAQKMEFLLEPAPDELAPSEEDLAAHLSAHSERFRLPARVALEQIFLDPARRGESIEGDVTALRRKLAAGADPASLGDRTMLPPKLDLAPVDSTARVFGSSFAEAVLDAPLGEWAGPLRSPYGLHLVRVTARAPARTPALEDVRDAVAEDWTRVRRREVVEERVSELTARYDIKLPDALREAGGPGVVTGNAAQ